MSSSVKIPDTVRLRIKKSIILLEEKGAMVTVPELIGLAVEEYQRKLSEA